MRMHEKAMERALYFGPRVASRTSSRACNACSHSRHKTRFAHVADIEESPTVSSPDQISSFERYLSSIVYLFVSVYIPALSKENRYDLVDAEASALQRICVRAMCGAQVHMNDTHLLFIGDVKRYVIAR